MAVLIAVPEDDPRRCQAVDSTYGQCRFQAVTNATTCPRHGGERQAIKVEKEKIRNYQLRMYRERVAQFSENPEVKSLREEIGITRLMIETLLNKCQDDTDLLMYSNKIEQLLQTARKLVESCHRIEERSGQLLDKNMVIVTCDSLVKVIANHITDTNVLDKIAVEVSEVIGKIGGLGNVFDDVGLNAGTTT